MWVLFLIAFKIIFRFIGSFVGLNEEESSGKFRSSTIKYPPGFKLLNKYLKQYIWSISLWLQSSIIMSNFKF